MWAPADASDLEESMRVTTDEIDELQNALSSVLVESYEIDRVRGWVDAASNIVDLAADGHELSREHAISMLNLLSRIDEYSTSDERLPTRRQVSVMRAILAEVAVRARKEARSNG